MDFTSINCPVCDKRFQDGDDIVVCPKCGAPYHRACYEIKNKCIFPELHKDGISWKEHMAKQNADKIAENADGDTIACLRCGHKNSKDSIVCERCGNFLPSPESRKLPDYFGQNFEDEEISDGTDNDDFPPNIFPGGNVGFTRIAHFPAGVKKDDDFDGVTGEELMSFVKANEMYYGPVFSNIRKKNTGRFNFATFFFFDVWYFFRKQYLKGILACLMTVLPIILNYVSITYFTGDLWKQAQSELSGGYYPNYISYLNWIWNHCDFFHGMMMLLPFIINFIVLVMKIVFSLRANRGYYNFCLDRVRKIKSDDPDMPHDELIALLKQKGGINSGVAFTVLACEVILAAALTLF